MRMSPILFDANEIEILISHMRQACASSDAVKQLIDEGFGTLIKAISRLMLFNKIRRLDMNALLNNCFQKKKKNSDDTI